MAARRGRSSRTYDAERTKQLILDAAEQAFSEHGFAGARIDAIADVSGYNKSLIYQYFGDKLMLYTEVIKRADETGEAHMKRELAQSLSDPSVTSDAETFQAFVTGTIERMFAFLFDHPRYVDILFWEAASNWKTWNDITYRPDDATAIGRLIEQARKNGIVRSDFDPLMFSVFVMNVTAGTIRFARRFDDDEMTDDTEANRRHMVEQVSHFVLRGLLDPSHFSA